jgi:hypothetical protein
MAEENHLTFPHGKRGSRHNESQRDIRSDGGVFQTRITLDCRLEDLPGLAPGREGKTFLLFVGILMFAYYLPLESPRVQEAVLEAFLMLQAYARNHTPALVVDGEVRVVGKVPSDEEITKMI